MITCAKFDVCMARTFGGVETHRQKHTVRNAHTHTQELRSIVQLSAHYYEDKKICLYTYRLALIAYGSTYLDVRICLL